MKCLFMQVGASDTPMVATCVHSRRQGIGMAEDTCEKRDEQRSEGMSSFMKRAA